MAQNGDCTFCREEKIKHELRDGTPCERGIYEDESTFAILSPEQYTAGHTLLILKGHKEDITDDLSEPDLSAFMIAVHKVAVRLKELAQNDRGEYPENIYVCILCDGIKHLHAHLIPRYPFTQKDKEKYKELFSSRDGDDVIAEAIKKEDLGGCWYITECEKNHKDTEFGRSSYSEKAVILNRLAAKLRTSE